MHYVSSVYFFSQSVHVSGIFVAHHDEEYCVCVCVCVCVYIYVCVCVYKYIYIYIYIYIKGVPK